MKAQKNKTLLILASVSPRRRELLKNAGLEFHIVPSAICEKDYPFTDPKSYARLLAEAKTLEVSNRYPDAWIIGADSIVVIEGDVLEKPASISEARQMIHMLNGRTHYVHTAYAIACKQKSHLFSDIVSTAVTFKTLTEKEIEWYIHTSEPYDKAGGYGVQGLGSFMVKRIQGSYTNVVGLPVCEVIDYLMKQGVITRDATPKDLIRNI
jgi:septum formation protein